MDKTVVLYENKDPLQKGVTHVKIETRTVPPYVFSVYFMRNDKDILRIGREAGDPNMVFMDVEQAKKLFKFKKGDISKVKFMDEHAKKAFEFKKGDN